MHALTYAIAFVALGLSALLYQRIRSPLSLPLWPLKILAGGLVAFLAVGGVLAALMGMALGLPLPVLAGAAGAALSGLHIRRVRAVARRPEQASRGVQAAPADAGRVRCARDVPFRALPGSRQLLCDVWQPAPGAAPSGVAVIYLHSSAWHMADKDVWTRPLFRHLAAQGHVVMDVGYRLCPEVDLYGMLADAQHAIAWMRANATRYGADPQRLVAAGASAGGHLALLAAYTAGHPLLTTGELRGVDTSVCAAVSLYGVADLRACYAQIGTLLPRSEWIERLAADPLPVVAERVVATLPGRPFAGQMCKLGQLSCRGIFTNLLGGTPEQVPALYDLASPITHAGPHCPPTLLVQGEHDPAVPVAATNALYERLRAAGVPATQIILPQTDHIFDLVLPQVSPAARTALAALDRFLASLA